LKEQTMKMDDIKQGFDSVFDSLAEGWQRLRESAAGALTRFTPGTKSALPVRADVDDESYLPSQAWSLLGGDVFEDYKRIIVRLEVPGMDKRDFSVEVREDALIVRGEKRFKAERTEGRYRVLQCAYGSFRRVVPLPAPIRPGKASARYKDGVLKVELPKLEPGQPKRITVTVG
jgi:HSP20 family protein